MGTSRDTDNCLLGVSVVLDLAFVAGRKTVPPFSEAKEIRLGKELEKNLLTNSATHERLVGSVS